MSINPTGDERIHAMSTLDEGATVTVRRAIKTYDDQWFLPRETAYVLALNGDRARVRCPDTGADGWLDVADLVPMEKRRDEARLAATIARASVLLGDAPTGACSSCGRLTWETNDFSTACGMKQPDGSRCSGIFRPEV